jgi:dGTPase
MNGSTDWSQAAARAASADGAPDGRGAAAPARPAAAFRPVDREQLLLAPWAMRSADSAGRRHPEVEHPYRGLYQRDRDRILHCSAFRRLSGKTQVFSGEMGDYHRTRLTHTFEVASIARTICRPLGLNEDLVEALALFHDVGHPPFGHAGERALDECLAADGGFSHNRHAVTIAEELEQRYPAFPGLNLTREVLESQAARFDKRGAGGQLLLEAQVVDAADSIAYDAHDTDDAVKVGLLTLGEMSELPLIARMLERVRERSKGIGDKLLRKALVHELIDFQVSDLLAATSQRLAEAAPASAGEARAAGPLVAPGPGLAAEKRELERFLSERVYRHPRLLALRADAHLRLRQLFEDLVLGRANLPPTFQRRVDSVGVRRAAAEYLAGMTERYFEQQFARRHPNPSRG